jgi:hypothetical protein
MALTQKKIINQAPEPVAVTLIVIQALDRLDIPYFVGDSLASALYGVVRSTLDTDIVAEVQPEHVERLVAILQDRFYIDADMIRDAIQHESSFNLIHLDSMFKVDIFIRKSMPFARNQMQRRVLQVVGEEPQFKIYVTTAEDIILAKLDWFRLGGGVSERQWQDVLGVLAVQGSQLDFDYMHKWANVLGFLDLLEKAIKEQ